MFVILFVAKDAGTYLGMVCSVLLSPAQLHAQMIFHSLFQPTEYNYMDAFEMNEVDGVIRTVIPLDRELVEVIRLGLVCEDLEATTEKQTATATLTILIEDTNDNDPQFRKPYYRRSLAENSKKGTTVASVVADDIDKNRTITYSMQVMLRTAVKCITNYLMI